MNTSTRDMDTAAQGGTAAENAPPTSAPIWELFSYRVFDVAGEKVGAVDQIWTDSKTGRPTFIGVRTGRFWKQTHVIPAGDQQIDGRARMIRVGYTRQRVQRAPCHNSPVHLTGDQERKVYTYYGHH